MIKFIAWLLRRRVAEYIWRGCVAHHLHSGKKGTAVFTWWKPMYDGQYRLYKFWLIRRDDGTWEWYPKCFFGRSEGWGLRVRDA